MPIASLTRVLRFAAAHRYRRPEWDDARNEQTFGVCARPHYHGHNYTCSVTVSGEIDPTTGMVISLNRLDAILAREVMARFDHKNINVEVPEFAEGRMVPTGENLARFILERVQACIENEAQVTRVTVAEDDSLSATFESQVPGALRATDRGGLERSSMVNGAVPQIGFASRNQVGRDSQP
jgi:6-pyruvoyltetrahydropterin/6-carboxytetrahydropterin synthase